MSKITIYSPPVTAQIKACAVDFDLRRAPVPVHLVQYDKTIPILAVSLYKGSSPYTLPADAEVNVRMNKRNNLYVYNPALGCNESRDMVYVAVTPQMTTQDGTFEPILEVVINSGVAGTSPLQLVIRRNPVQEDAIEDTSEVKTLTELVSQAAASATAAAQSASAAAASAQQAAGSAADAREIKDSMPADYTAMSGDVGTLKNQMQLAYPDNSTICENPWSSKNTVDMLCPPIEESSNPVVCYPVAGYPLGVKAKWEPMQEGSGTPSSENIRPIKGRDSVAIERCGENLVKFPYRTSSANKNGLVFTSHQDGSITVDGTATADTWYMVEGGIEKRLPMNTPITLSGCLAGGSIRSYYIGLYLGGKWFSDVGNGNTNIKFTTREIASRVEISIVKGTVCNSLTFYPKIEVGTTITPYNKYQGSTNTLTLPETVYEGEVDAVSGEGQETWEMLTLDGTTNKFTQSDRFWRMPSNSAPGVVNTYATICSHFPANTFGGNQRGSYIFTTANIMSRYFPDVNALNAYIVAQYAAGTPVQVCYKLAEPVPFTATGAKPLPALAGVNTVLTDADSATVTGRADPIKRITDLEDAVASQT